MTIHVGVDLHQRFCYLTAVDASGRKLAQQSVVNEAGSLRQWLGELPGPKQVVVEACGFWPAFRRAVEPVAERVVMVHPKRVKAIAEARLKNDRVDSEMLAHLSRCDLLPEAWMADEATRALRRQVRLRITLGQQRSRLKNLLQSVLHQEGHIKPVTDLFGKRGQQWLAGLPLESGARGVVESYRQLIVQLDEAIATEDRKLEQMAANDARARWLQTVPGIGAYSALVIVAEIGDLGRFATKKSLANYAGLVPRVKESAGKRARGKMTREGSKTLRWILLQVAQVAARCDPAARAYYQRMRQRKPAQVAKVALARKLLTVIWALLRHGVCYDAAEFAAE